MSTLVTNELFARLGRGDDVATLLSCTLVHEPYWRAVVTTGAFRPGPMKPRQSATLGAHGSSTGA